MMRNKGKSLQGIFVYPLTVFLSAFLLFQVQPLISRYILPWFGGTPSVWSASLLFFQTLLLVGYGFAHWLSFGKRWKLGVYLVLLVLAVLFVIQSTRRWGSPLLPGDQWKPAGADQPIAHIVMVLLVSVGLPYFLLSTTSPLIQSWFKYLNTKRTPYHLYAFSNFGSFVGLISYPFIVEPFFSLKEQSWFWFILYLTYTGLCAFLGLKVFSILKMPGPGKNTLEANEDPVTEARSSPTPPRIFLWIALSACTSILLLSVTNQLTQEVAVIPFLWVLPLSLYLLSFTVTFSGDKWYAPVPMISLLAVATLGVGYALLAFKISGVFYQILIFSLFLFFATLVCHGELYRLRPDAGYLTAYYLYISLGGVIGGVFVNLAAPGIFNGYWELHLGILICWLLIFGVQFYKRPSLLDVKWSRIVIPILVLILGASGYLLYKDIDSTVSGVLTMQRNFFGVIRVRVIGIGDSLEQANGLSHGLTSHGFQFRDDEKRSLPTSYYGPSSGIGLALTHYHKAIGGASNQASLNVGMIGLGTGTLAAYADPGDHYRIYEINPIIIDLARGDGGYFTFLEETQATFEIIPGDARISLERELNGGDRQAFDILAVDAFSSDAIPVHLLTEEAIHLYLQHLEPGGVLAVHISNRYLDLEPLVRSLADGFHLENGLITNPRDNEIGTYASVWMLLSQNKAFFQIPEIKNNLEPAPEPPRHIRIWTDDYSNLIPLIRDNVFEID